MTTTLAPADSPAPLRERLLSMKRQLLAALEAEPTIDPGNLLLLAQVAIVLQALDETAPS
jgi:hypothetical protein